MKNSYRIAAFLASFAFVSCGTNNAPGPVPAPPQQPGSVPTPAPTVTTPAPVPTGEPGTTSGTTADLQGTWAGKHSVLKVASDGSMNLNLGCNTARIPALSLDSSSGFSTSFTAHSNAGAMPPGNEMDYSGELKASVSGNTITLAGTMTPPHPLPSHTDSIDDVLHRGQMEPSDPLLCAMGH